MEKIWIKKEFYFKSYWFLNILDFFWILYLIFIDFSLFKKRQKWGFILHRTRGTDVACETHVARGTRADATWHARPRGRAAWAHAEPRWREGGADSWHGPRKSTQTPGWHHVASEGASRWRAHGLVGPGWSIGAVTQMRYFAPAYILTFSSLFLRVGLCSL